MPARHRDLTAAAASVETTVTIDTERAILKGAILFDPLGTQPAGDAWAQIVILDGGNELPVATVQLASGYAGGQNGVSWFGSLPLGPDSHIHARVFSIAGGTYRLAIDTWPWVGVDNGRVIMDP